MSALFLSRSPLGIVKHAEPAQVLPGLSGETHMNPESARILQLLTLWRTTISASARMILRDLHRAGDVFLKMWY